MILNRLLAILFLCCSGWISAQTNYTSYFTGNPADAEVIGDGGTVLMGGAGENDPAMVWFLERANGGDVLVLRASGADGYNDYFYSELGVTVNSVETIVFNDWTAASEPYVLDKINRAEAIWFAGGDQWDYVSYWRGTGVATGINNAISERGAVVGGISAGMAILGSIYFTAENGTVTSDQATANPYHPNITLSGAPFLDIEYLTGVITDTHYDDPDRRARHSVFLARAMVDMGVNARGIACDEFTAVCIAPDGIARIFGEYPSFDDNVYFIHSNCNLEVPGPEVIGDGSPITWNRGGEALYAYRVKGTETGEHTFDLNDWQTASGGEWLNWSIDEGVFNEAPGSDPACNPLSVDEFEQANISLFPNPVQDQFQLLTNGLDIKSMAVYNQLGQQIFQNEQSSSTNWTADASTWSAGTYYVRVETLRGEILIKKIIKQ
ncbi:T9SS type A sorting domain-containing protein [Gilvibacter sediminis]|uniref:T9SS type A sorting domain-containing protein n=1 Tax=Gilvibacter sediminis TaxID=379071 RepID=UPI002350FB19|nr:T9SS type A sorting domain-containing protein [Gilvibacter sediminis]MDC7997902.1 T9SS type A sorting domain-containing protein [Gilvibacter sediminis]